MAISLEAIQTILGIKDTVYLTPGEMTEKLTVTFFPYQEEKVSDEVKEFAVRLKKSLCRLKVNIVPYEDTLAFDYYFSLVKLPKYYFFALSNEIAPAVIRFLGKKREVVTNIPGLGAISEVHLGRKIRKGTAIITLGENPPGKLPMDYTTSFTKNPIITVVDMPEGINAGTGFHKHFDTAMRLFSHHMTHIVIAVDKEKWLLYNMNASHPMYPVNESEEEFDRHILSALIPKIAAPIKAPRLSEFIIEPEGFDPQDSLHAPLIDDMVKSGPMLEQSGLYPPGRTVEDLPFRNDLYKWIGALHLDGRSGMSYGFVARQLPVALPKLIPLKDAYQIYKGYINDYKDYFVHKERLFLRVDALRLGNYVLEIPDVWILTQRSGSRKTSIDPRKDIIKIGLVGGKMVLQYPEGLKVSSDCRPSFDTKVILAHAVGNAIIGAILLEYYPENRFSHTLVKHGMALAHWHGYIQKRYIPHGFHVYGWEKPHVSCSSPQSAIYAFQGKIRAFEESVNRGGDYVGDIHIEPQHGINITFSSLEALGRFLNEYPNISELGNRYLHDYDL